MLRRSNITCNSSRCSNKSLFELENGKAALNTIVKFIYEKSPFDFDEINKLIKNSKPAKVSKLFMLKPCYNFDLGEFVFKLKNLKGETFEMPFYYNNKNLNVFWKFLEVATFIQKAIYLDIINGSCETFIYLEPINKYYFRFIVMGSKIVMPNSINPHFGYFIRYDVIIKKKEFINQFYTKISEIMTKYEVIAYFEPPLIDFDYWVKNSKIIYEYLKGKARRKNATTKK